MEHIDLSTNRFLTDFRIKKFILTSNGQEYELAISNILSEDYLTFYTIFKPVDYDHIIYMSAFNKSWKNAKKIFKDVVLQVIDNYNINIEEYHELQLFIDNI
ncbi:MAG: hypothetical protein ACO3UU_13405 [Minisyncoccia bacterium]